MKMLHSNLTKEHWFTFPTLEQMANIGVEVSRAIRFRQKGKNDLGEKAFFRALELLYFTKGDPKNHNHRLKELCRLYECLVDYFAGDNVYGSSDELLEKYFLGYNRVCRILK